MPTNQIKPLIPELYLAGGQRVRAPRNLPGRIRRSAEFTIIEKPAKVVCIQSTTTDFVIEVTTNLGTVIPIDYPFTTNSDKAYRQALHRKEKIREYTYSRGLSLGADPLPQELPPNFCSGFSPVRLFPPPHCSWGLLNWFGMENAKRFADDRLADPEFISQLNQESLGHLPDDDPRRIEWERKIEEAGDLIYGETPSEITYGSGDSLGMALVRSFRIPAPLFAFGQQHFVFQSRVLLHLRLDAVNILKRIKQHFEDPVTKTIGNLSAAQFQSLYAEAQRHHNTPIDEELFWAWHPSQHGVVPLLLQHFDPDLLIRLLPAKYREALCQEAVVWRNYLFQAMTLLTSANMKVESRSIFELLPSEESVLDFLKVQPDYGQDLREQEKRLEYVLSLPYRDDQIPRLTELGLRWLDGLRADYVLRNLEFWQTPEGQKQSKRSKPNLVDYLESEPTLREQLRDEEEARNRLLNRPFSAAEIPEIRRTIADWPPRMRQMLNQKLDDALEQDRFWRNHFPVSSNEAPGSSSFQLTEEQKALHRKIVQSPFRFSKKDLLEDWHCAREKAVESIADELALQVHRHALENARYFLVEGHGPAVAIVAITLDTLYAKIGGRFMDIRNAQIPSTARSADVSTGRKGAKGTLDENPLLALKRDLLNFYFTPKRIALFRPRMAAYPDDTTLKQLVSIVDKADRLPRFRLLTPEQRNEYWDTRKEMTKLRKQLTEEVRSFRPPPLSPAELDKLNREFIQEITGSTMNDLYEEESADDS